MVQRIADASEIESLDPSAIPRVRAPERATVFKARADRLVQLAERGNPVAGYLRAMAGLARAQHDVLATFSALPPSREQIERAQQHSMPLLPPFAESHDPAWRDVLARLIEAMRADTSLPAPFVALLDALKAADAATLDAQADAITAGRLAEIDPAAAPFVVAALQVVWTDIAADIDARDVPYLDTPGLCPVCGSHPVASTVRVGGAVDSYRYLQCGLCATEWHVVRSKCSNCDSTKGIAYHVAGTPDADEKAKEADSKKALVKAESCDECHTYRKIGYQQHDYDYEPFADDLATLTLDLLMGEEGYRRASPHPWLWPEWREESAERDAPDAPDAPDASVNDA